MKIHLSEKTETEFKNNILPKMNNWLHNQLNKPETQNLGYETMIIELLTDAFKTHEIRYL